MKTPTKQKSAPSWSCTNLQEPACGPDSRHSPSAFPICAVQFFHTGPWSSTLQFTTNIAFSLNFKYLLEHSKDLKRVQPSLFILFSSQPCIAGRDDLPPAPYCSLPKAGKASSPHAADTSKAPKPFMNQMKHKRTQAERSNCSLWAFVFPLNPHLTWTHRKVFSALQSLPQIT